MHTKKFWQRVARHTFHVVRWRIGTGTLGFQVRIVLCRRMLLETKKIIDLLNLCLEQQNLLLELPDLPLLSGFL